MLRYNDSVPANNSPILGVHHISIKPHASRFQQVIDFYHGLLGLPVAARWQKDDGTEMAFLHLGTGYLEIISVPDDEEKPAGALEHMALATDAVDELLDRVAAAGYEIITPAKDIVLGTTPPQPARIGFCRGPVGEKIEFFCVK